MPNKRNSDPLLRILTITFAALIAMQMIIAPVSAGVPSKINLKIGILLPVSGGGGLGVIGQDEERSAQIAVKQANKVLASGTTGVNFTTAGLTIDSATDPTVADTGFKNLVDTLGVRIVVGAAGSREVAGFKADADLRQVAAISPSSTAASLAIVGDYIFRAPGNDLLQAPAIAAWIYHQGIRHLAVITRQDPYGTGIRDGAKNKFLTFSGTEIADVSTTTYDPDSISAAEAATVTLNSQIGTLLGHPGATTANTGVLMISFEDDGNAIFAKAATQTNLPNVNWFGTDGIGLSDAFLPVSQGGTGSTAVASFMANKVNVTGSFATAPAPGPGQSSVSTLYLDGASVAKAGGGSIDLTALGFHDIYAKDPQGYGDYSYDSAVLAMLAVLKSNSYVGASIAAQIIPVGAETIGATGLLALGPDGDRASQEYVFYYYKYNSTSMKYYWDSSTGPFYNFNTGAVVGTLPSLSESGGTIWTTLLQTLAAGVTVAVWTFPNVYLAVSVLFLAATAVLTITRRRRL